MDATELPQPPSVLRELYTLSLTSETHTSIFYADRDASTLSTPTSPSPDRPFVTLTFAQSLDAKIAGAGGKQLILSGKESLIMTHWMRTLHDAILVGIGTALNDDPQLNTRHLPPLPPNTSYTYRLPRPIILDTHLRTSPTCKLLRNFRAGTGRRPWLVCAPYSFGGADADANTDADEELAARAEALRAAGAEIITVQTEVKADGDSEAGTIGVRPLLAALHARGVRSVMVEGGARVIRSFLHAARGAGRDAGEGGEDVRTGGGGGAIDALVVTVAPVLVGDAGVGYGAGLHADELPSMQHVRTEMFGRDAVMALKVL